MPIVFLAYRTVLPEKHCDETFNIEAVKLIYDSMSLLETFHSDYHLSSRLIIYFAVRARNDKRISTRMYVINDNSTRSKHRVRVMRGRAERFSHFCGLPLIAFPGHY